MKVLVVQFDDRPLEALGLRPFLIDKNRAYAQAQGYEYRFGSRMPVDVPAYWQKPHVCRHFLANGYDVVLWLDTDAVVHDPQVRIESLFAGDEAMVAAGDNPAWASPFNAGVFAVRGERGARIMERWAGLFDPALWTRDETAWRCTEEFAGDAFEQGAFVNRLMPELLASGDLRLEPWNRLQSPFPVPGCFTLHFAGFFAPNMAAYVSAY